MQLMDERLVSNYLITYIEYGDTGDMTTAEIQEVDNWLSRWPDGHCMEYQNDYNHSVCDVTGLRSDVTLVKIYW